MTWHVAERAVRHAVVAAAIAAACGRAAADSSTPPLAPSAATATLATASSGVTFAHAHRDHLYWIGERQQDTVWRAPLDGGAAETQQIGCSMYGSPSFDRGVTFVPCEHELRRVEAGRSTRLAQLAPASILATALDGEHVYMVVEYPDEGPFHTGVLRVPRDGGAPVRLDQPPLPALPAERKPLHLAVDARHISLASIDGSIWQLPRGGGPVTLLFTDHGNGMARLASDGVDLYSVASHPKGGQRLVRHRASGGPPVTLVASQRFAWYPELFVVGRWLYFHDGSVRRVHLDRGGPPETLLTGDDRHAVAVIGDRLIWSERQPDGQGRKLQRSPLGPSGAVTR